MAITREQALKAEVFHMHRDGHYFRLYRNGHTKTWSRFPERFVLPVRWTWNKSIDRAFITSKTAMFVYVEGDDGYCEVCQPTH